MLDIAIMRRLRVGENDICEITLMLLMNGMTLEKRSFQNFELRLKINNLKNFEMNLDLKITTVIFQHLRSYPIN